MEASGGVLAGFGGALMPRAQVSEAWREHLNMAPFLHGPGRASISVLCPSYTRSVLGSGRTACALTESQIYRLNDANKYRPMAIFFLGCASLWLTAGYSCTNCRLAAADTTIIFLSWVNDLMHFFVLYEFNENTFKMHFIHTMNHIY